MINKNNKTSRGFTLIETLLAILILTVAIAGPLTIAAKGLQLTLIARDQLVAAALAQEALEYVHFVRDTNKLNGSDWLAGLDGTSNGHTTNMGGGQANCTGGNYCTINSLTDQVSFCGTSLATCGTSYLYYDDTGGVYTYVAAGNTQSIFSRTISISTPSPGGNGNEADVEVVVQWKDVGGFTRSVELRDTLLNWQ